MIPTTNIRLSGPILILLLGLVWLTAGQAAATTETMFTRPVNGSVTLRFGQKYVDDASGKTRTHRGIDIGTSLGTRIAAAADGQVSFAGHTPLGNCVSIKHPNGVKTTYLPCAKLTVGSGAKVRQGETIGYLAAGGDGSTESSHLHVGALFAGKYIDPESLFRGEFQSDYSRLIRRGDIPPVGNNIAFGGLATATAAPFLAWPVSLWTTACDWLADCWAAHKAFLGRIGDVGISAFHWLRSLTRPTVSFFRRWIRRSGNGHPALLVPGRDWRFDSGRGLDPAGAGGIYRLDPSGDAGYPTDRLSLNLAGHQPARALEIFNSAGARIRVIAAWEAGTTGIVWTGEDDSGRIVPAGLYTVILRHGNGSVTACLAEVRWHS